MHAVRIEPIHAAYVMVPKAASTSIKHAILHLLDGKHFVGKTRLRIAPLEVTSLRRVDYPDTFRFSCVRNPWSRLVSCFRDKIERRSQIFRPFEHYGWRAGMKFGEFLLAVCALPNAGRDGHFATQTSLTTDGSGEWCVDHMMRLESIGPDWARLQAIYPTMPPLRVNGWQGPKIDYHEWYNAETWELAREAFVDDIERFGYSDDSL